MSQILIAEWDATQIQPRSGQQLAHQTLLAGQPLQRLSGNPEFGWSAIVEGYLYRSSERPVVAEADSPAGLGAAHGAEDRRHDDGEVLDDDGVPVPAPTRPRIAWSSPTGEQEYRAAYRAARG